MKKNKNIRTMTTIAILGAIILLLGFSHLGIIHLGIIPITILHIPVLIGCFVEGPKVGISVGLIFGLFSFIHAITDPTPVSFIFMNPIISVVPRIMIGVVASYSYIIIRRLTKSETASIAISAFLGSLTNTVLVMGLIYFLYADNFGSVFKLNQAATNSTIIGIMIANGLPEAIVAVILSVPISKALIKNKKS